MQISLGSLAALASWATPALFPSKQPAKARALAFVDDSTTHRGHAYLRRTAEVAWQNGRPAVWETLSGKTMATEQPSAPALLHHCKDLYSNG